MTIIRKFIDRVDEELDDAQHYAEKYIECKARDLGDTAGKYHAMSEDELKHAGWLHEMAAATSDACITRIELALAGGTGCQDGGSMVKSLQDTPGRARQWSSRAMKNAAICTRIFICSTCATQCASRSTGTTIRFTS